MSKIDWHAVQHRALTTGFCAVWMLSILYSLSAFSAAMAESGQAQHDFLVRSIVAATVAAIAMCAHAAEIRFNMKYREQRGERRDR